MSPTPPQLEGQIEAPNPMELFWEKNKLFINLALIAACLALIVNYGLRYLHQRKIDELWGGLAINSGFDAVYAKGGSRKMLFQLAGSNPQLMPAVLSTYYGTTKAELLSRLPETLRDSDQGELEAFLAGEAKGTPAEPLTLWALANRALENQQWDQASARLDSLEKGFPTHFLCQGSSYSVQWRDQVEPADDAAKPEDQTPKKPAKPELLPAKAGSALAELRARIAEERQFRAEHIGYYEAPKPDFAKAVVFDFGELGKVKVGLYEDLAPEHRDAFLRLAEAGFWVGQRINEVSRPAEERSFQPRPGEIHFGLVSSKKDSISSWQDDEELADEANALPWETSSLSHFPFMVAAEPYTEGRSQIQRVVINVDDAAASRDGSRVIFGRVLEGMEVIREILGSELSTESEETAGQGRPVDFITIEAVTVVDRE